MNRAGDIASTHRPRRPATRPGGPDAIDRTHLARYTLGDAFLEREILGLFLAQLPLTVESLRFAASDRDWVVAAHTLKGSARAVGAWKVADLALRAEKLCAMDESEARDAILAGIEAAAAEVEAYVGAALPADPH